MKIVNTIIDIRAQIKKYRIQNKTIGFVPTMGYLHEGHLSLMKKAKEENDIVIISIFVNPTQFGISEDLESYPKDLDRDSMLVEEIGVDLIFAPTNKEMYPFGYNSFVEVKGEITKKLCGKSRPGHFKGVTTIVSKLFNIVMPDRAYFGQKDAQQLAVIKQMTEDLNFNIEVKSCPIIRETDGLALSSRNTYLSNNERADAIVLSESLFIAEEMIKNGEKNVLKILKKIENNINKVNSAKIDYVEIVNSKTLEQINTIQGNILIVIAVKIGKTRLIDNIMLEV